MVLTEQQIEEFAKALESSANNFRDYVISHKSGKRPLNLTDKDCRSELSGLLRKLELD